MEGGSGMFSRLWLAWEEDRAGGEASDADGLVEGVYKSSAWKFSKEFLTAACETQLGYSRKGCAATGHKALELVYTVSSNRGLR